MDRPAEGDSCMCAAGLVWDNGDHICAGYTECEEGWYYAEEDNSCQQVVECTEWFTNCAVCAQITKAHWESDEPANICYSCHEGFVKDWSDMAGCHIAEPECCWYDEGCATVDE